MLRYVSLSLGQETDVAFPFCSSSEFSVQHSLLPHPDPFLFLGRQH